ncbi:tripartite tricarboxylate transporter substrate-binding protein [Ottowia thiooxydans]|uniref:tripartite tricarboxylate transporter substrate-binding protein n=1 Tax=Ottowia thiooxydans TaxID=219182 RepID=UPI00040F8C18|nr:tripartite tricarboxylate transporter substrate-binding protein [Ottowia thiooxydans]
MHISLRQLRVLLAVADHGSFSSAAHAIGLSQSAVSQGVRAVEESLGTQLIERSTRHVRLTPAGEALIAPLRDALDRLESVLVEARSAGAVQQKVIQIAATPHLSGRLLSQCLADAARRYPDLQVQLREQPQPAAIESVRRGAVEFGLAVGDERITDLIQTRVLRDQFMLICRNDHPFARRKVVELAQLQLERLILLATALGGRSGLNSLLRGHGVAVEAAQEVTLAATAMEMAAEGLGIAILPASRLPMPDQPSLRAIGLEPSPVRDIVLIRRKGIPISDAAQKLHDLILKRASGADDLEWERPLTLLIPFPEGGPVDRYGRVFGEILSRHLHQRVVVKNAVGLGGAQGVHELTRSEADGYTIGIAGNGATVFTGGGEMQGFVDVFKDLTFLSGLVRVPSVLVAGKHLPISNLSEMLAQARLHPRGLRIAAAGHGSSRVLAELLQELTDVSLHIELYDGLTPAVRDIARGKVDLVFGEPIGVLPLIQSQKGRAILIAGSERCPLLPDVPSASELSLEGLATDGGYGLIAPASLPTQALTHLSGAVADVLRSTEIAEQFDQLGVKPDMRSGPFYEDFIRSEQKKWRTFNLSRRS